MKKLLCVPAMLVAILLSACFALPVEEPVLPPPIIKTAESAMYRTITVARGDVSKYRDLSPSYVAAREEQLAFSVSDIYIKDVYVEVGDNVKEGDIIAELDMENIENDLANTAQEEEWARLNLKHLDERHDLDLLEAEITDNLLDEASYLDERNTLLTQLEAIRIRSEHLTFEQERRVLRAGMDGTVTQVTVFREGDTSTADQRVVTVTDQTQSVFMLRGMEIEYFQPGDRYELTVDGEVYEAEVIAPEATGISRVNDDEIYLMVISEEQPAFTTRSYAKMQLILDEVKDTLYVPYAALKKANARVFVYVLEDGIRTIRDVEIGLEGNTQIEIRSGLTEGETVIVD